MKQVAKLVIIDDSSDAYLMMYRSQHPTFGENDPDLPGGTLDEGESPLETMVREVHEEIGVTINIADARELYAGTGYSEHGTHKVLYIARLSERPELKLSWEHSGYKWLDRDTFLAQAKNAEDTYMHMAYAVLKDQSA